MQQKRDKVTNMDNFPAYKTISTADLIPYARNSRTHSDAQVAKLAASIREFGFLNPIIVDGQKGIIAGHGRVMAAQKLGMETLPCIEADHLTDAQRRAYVIADNRMALDAGWDDELLKVELKDLDAVGFDLTLTGFELDEINGFLLEPEPAGPAAEVSEDVEPHDCVLGDVFKIGRHIIACGDSSDQNTIDAVLRGDDADTVLCDPPFDVPETWTFMHRAPNAIVFCDYKTTPMAINCGHGYEYCYHFVWDGVTSWYTPNRPLARHKSAFVFMSDPKWLFNDAVYYDGKNRSAKTVSNTRGTSDYVPLDGGMVHLQTVFQSGNTRQDDGGHAHSKPNEWIRALMMGCGARIVLDQFAGSGGFSVAAPDCVSVRSIELDPQTCGRAITRIADATGCQPEHI